MQIHPHTQRQEQIHGIIIVGCFCLSSLSQKGLTTEMAGLFIWSMFYGFLFVILLWALMITIWIYEQQRQAGHDDQSGPNFFKRAS